MKAYLLNEAGAAEQLQLLEIEKPTPKSDEVLIKVKALSVNPVDIKTRIGKSLYAQLRKQGPIILGWDVSGTVAAIGKDVVDFQLGDEVFGMVNFPGHGKAYAEYVAVPAAHLAQKPKNISHEEAAGATLAALTAYQILNRHIKPNDKVLIHAAAGGVGHFAVQIAKHLGAHVTGTASEKNIDFVKSLGADAVIDYTKQPFETVLSNQDFVLDALSGETLKSSLVVVKKGGTIISLPSGGLDDGILTSAKEKDVKVAFEIVESNGTDMRQIANWLEKGLLKTHIFESYPFERLIEAHQQVESGRTKGKVIITL